MASYEASIHLLLKDDVTNALARIATDVLGLHGKFDKLRGSIKEVGVGLAAIGGGAIMAKFTKDVVEANAALEKQINIFKMMGNSQSEANALRSRSWDTIAQVRGARVADVAQHGRELVSALNDNPGAMKMLPDFERVSQLLDFQQGGQGEDNMRRLAKMIELRGGAIDRATDTINPTLFKGELDAAFKALEVGGGLVTANDLQMMIKRGGPAVKNMMGNPETFWKEYLAVVEDQGGAAAGTATTAVARQFLGGKGQGPTYKEMLRLGLLNDEGWHVNKQHNITIDDPKAAIKGFDILQKEGVQALVEKILRPALEAHGYRDSDSQNAELYRLVGTETARRELGLFLSNRAQAEAVAKRYDRAMIPDDAAKVMNADFTHNLESVGAALHNFASAIGDAASVAPALGKIADNINSFSKAIAANPTIAKTVTTDGILGAAGLTGFGLYKIGSSIWSRLSAGTEKAVAEAATKSGVPAVPLSSGMGALLKGGLRGGLIGGVIETLGEQAIEIGLGALPKPKGPAGYDANAEMNRGVWGDIKSLGESLKSWFGAKPDDHAAADTGRKVADEAVKGFKTADFGPGGKQAGDAIVAAFLSAGFAQAGAAAAAKISAAIAGATVAAPKIGSTTIEHHSEIHIDGRQVATAVTRHQAQMAMFPGSIAGGPDGHGSYIDAGYTMPSSMG